MPKITQFDSSRAIYSFYNTKLFKITLRIPLQSATRDFRWMNSFSPSLFFIFRFHDIFFPIFPFSHWSYHFLLLRWSMCGNIMPRIHISILLPRRFSKFLSFIWYIYCKREREGETFNINKYIFFTCFI